MTGAKKLNDAILIETGRINTHRNWPFEDTLPVFWGKFRRPLAPLDRCTLNKGAFAFKIVRGALKWPLKGASRLIEVAATAGLTVPGSKCRGLTFCRACLADLGQNCLLRLSLDDNSSQRVKINLLMLGFGIKGTVLRY